jgi:cellulose synthase (UDP-forming)
MQVLRHDNPLTATGLTLRQRLGYVYSLSAWFDSWRTLGMALVPVTVLATGLFPVAAPPVHFAVMAGSAYVLQQLALTLLGRGFAPARFSLLFEVVRMPSNLAATLTLVRSGTGRFAVTAKGRTGSARRRARVPALLLVLAAVLGGTLVYAAATLAGWTPTDYRLSGTIVVPLFWVAATLGFVVAGIRRIRDPRFADERRDGHRFPTDMLALVGDAPARVRDVSLGGAQVQTQGDGAVVGSDVELAIAVPDRREPVRFRAVVRSREGAIHRLQFVGRQWTELAALSSTAFGAGSARWGATAAEPLLWASPRVVPASSRRHPAAAEHRPDQAMTVPIPVLTAALERALAGGPAPR